MANVNMHESKQIISFVGDILTKREEANKEDIHHDAPLKALLQGALGLTVMICLATVVIGVVIGNYLLEPQSDHTPAFLSGKYLGGFVKDYPFVLLIVFAVSALFAWRFNFKPTISGMQKKDIVFLGKMTADQLDLWTRQRSGKTFRPPQGFPLRISYDFTFELAVSSEAEVRYSFDQEPRHQTLEINVTHRHVHEYQPISEALEPPNRMRFLGKKPQARLEHHPVEQDDLSSRKAKLEALANDPKASPDERIAALNKLKNL